MMWSAALSCMTIIWILVGSLACQRNCGSQKEDNDRFILDSVVYKNEVSTSSLSAGKVWLFAVDGRRKPYNFLDENGKLVGFDVDFISKVCSVVQKKCKIVLAEFTECTITERNINYAGRGLMSGWFDGCPGYVLSLDRQGAFDFTEPYLATDASFTVSPGNPSGFDPDLDDYSKFTLTHLTGAVTNAQCLNRLHKKFGKIIVAADLPDAKELLLNRTADVLFSARRSISGLEVLPQRVHCEMGGTGVMLKKGSELAQWWNPAFQTLVLSGGYAQFCAESETKYNATFRCLSGLKAGHIISGKPLTPATQTMSQDAADQRVWLFALSGRRKPFAFQDEEGRLSGFNIDFVRAVCAEAKQVCDFVLSQFTECSFTQRNINYAGRGLMDGWFDACMGYADSVDRAAAVDFTDAFLESSSTFTVVPGNPSGFDPDQQDFSNFTFTHLTGAYTNAQCLNRLKKKFGKIVIAANLPEAKELLFDRKADVLFSPRGKIPDLEVLPQRVHCERTGSAIMTKRGSPLVDWWNAAFRSLVRKGLYQKVCEEGRVKYNFPIRCFPENTSLPTSGYPEDYIIG
ncbi:uncharacterized protein LOC101861674 [Aplysia californica]|uniref:Uncharacterized protein LOC101861674 n=1 Tax=Aplysia californica TaxID=6500 RepID=A0ABM0JXJ1_APLCA|nr:uncharacterized protein LOC101861674 [Aplysia californica]